MSQPTPKFKTSRPNIVLFLTDDHARWAHGCYGNVEVQTPNLDSLAREGVLFENAFTPTPVCSPARACLLTGRTASQVGIHDWLQEEIPGVCGKDWLDGEVTLPEMLSCAGYVCGLSGKWHLGQSYQTPRGFSWRSCQIGGDGHHEGHYSIQVDGRTVPLIGNKTKIFTDQALEFLDNVPLEQPFFLNIGYIATHSPYEAQAHDPETVALYRDATFCDIPEYKPHPWARNDPERHARAAPLPIYGILLGRHRDRSGGRQSQERAKAARSAR